jgi:hypothetical protein
MVSQLLQKNYLYWQFTLVTFAFLARNKIQQDAGLPKESEDVLSSLQTIYIVVMNGRRTCDRHTRIFGGKRMSLEGPRAHSFWRAALDAMVALWVSR